MIKSLLERRCKFAEHCPFYTNTSMTCNKRGGYYHFDRPAGCYIVMMREMEKDE